MNENDGKINIDRQIQSQCPQTGHDYASRFFFGSPQARLFFRLVSGAGGEYLLGRTPGCAQENLLERASCCGAGRPGGVDHSGQDAAFQLLFICI